MNEEPVSEDEIEDFENSLYDFCPKCGREYDEIDYEYQNMPLL